MGFFDKIISIFRGPDYDKKNKTLSERIAELWSFRRKTDEKLDKEKKYSPDLSWYKVEHPSSETKKEFPTYSPKSIRQNVTMKDLLEKRKREEAERIRELEATVSNSLLEVRVFINEENVEEAERKLFQTAPLIAQIKNESLISQYNSLSDDIDNLKQLLIEREVKCKEEAERRRQEAERKRKEAEELKRKRAEEERQRREREAREYEERLAAAARELQEEIERLTELTTRQKNDAYEIRTYLQANNVRVFYHFTDCENLNSIRRLGGLYSWKYLKDKGIEIPNPGGDDLSRSLDVRNGLPDFVRLSFCDDHPMAWRKHQSGAELVLLRISVDVATFQDTLFTNKNAASNSFSKGGNLEALKKVNIPATKRGFVSRSEGEIFELHQAECMVRTFIPIKYITNIDNPERMIF